MKFLRVFGNKIRRLLTCSLLFCITTFATSLAQQANQNPSLAPNANDTDDPVDPKASTEGIGSLKLAKKPLEVLSGYLTVQMPEGARSKARPFPIMGAPESDEHETRIIVDAGKERLVLLAKESFAIAGKDFEKEVKQWVSRWRGKYKFEVLPLTPEGLKAVSVIPVDEPDRTRSNDATFVEGLFLQSDQGTIQSLDVFINSPAEKDLAGCKILARQILQSVAKGKKKRDLTAGERRIGFSKDQDISVKIPKNTMLTEQVGPDFVVHRLTVLGELGAEGASMLIYIGMHPSFKPQDKKGPAMIFGKQVNWYAPAKGKELEALCNLPAANGLPLKAHVIIHASSDVELKRLKEAAESLVLVQSKEPPR